MPSASGSKMKVDDAAKKKREAKTKYMAKAKTDTVEAVVGVADLERELLKEGEWEPAWGHVEFDFDACLRNITKEGKTKDGFFVPAGTILPLGAALPEMTVLKYGGYFPAGTTFQGGIMIPIHARMVNLLPQPSFDPKTMLEESLCCVQ